MTEKVRGRVSTRPDSAFQQGYEDSDQFRVTSWKGAAGVARCQNPSRSICRAEKRAHGAGVCIYLKSGSVEKSSLRLQRIRLTLN